eukprot:SAG31_NODE_1066_length_10091_cov_5.779323_8_plen_185_part_00
MASCRSERLICGARMMFTDSLENPPEAPPGPTAGGPRYRMTQVDFPAPHCARTLALRIDDVFCRCCGMQRVCIAPPNRASATAVALRNADAFVRKVLPQLDGAETLYEVGIIDTRGWTTRDTMTNRHSVNPGGRNCNFSHCPFHVPFRIQYSYGCAQHTLTEQKHPVPPQIYTSLPCIRCQRAG